MAPLRLSIVTRPILAVSIVLLASRAIFPQGAEKEEPVQALKVQSFQKGLWLSAKEQLILYDLPVFGVSYARNGKYIEGLELGLAGSIYHPNLLTYNVGLRLGLSQLEGSGVGAPPLNQDLSLNYNIIMNWLQKKPVSLGLYAFKGDSFPDYGIFEPSRVGQTTLGGVLRLASPVLPTALTLEKATLEQRSQAWLSTDDSLVARLDSEWSTEDRRSRGRGGYAFTLFSRALTGNATQEGRSHEGNVSHDLEFDAEGRYRLASSLRYLGMQGFLEQNSLALAERLEMAISPELSNQTQYGFQATWNPLAWSLTQTGHVSFVQRVYESLVASIGVRTALGVLSDGSQNVVGPLADLRYKKDIDIGTLYLNYVGNVELDQRETTSGLIRVNDESLVLEDGMVTLLASADVQEPSVVVTDSSGKLVYVRGVDYSLERFGSRLRVARVPGGRIAKEATVLVSYASASQPSTLAYNHLQDVGIRLSFFEDSLGLSYSYQERSAPVLASTGASGGRLVETHHAGLTLEADPVSGELEFERFTSADLAYYSWRTRQGLSWRPLPATTIALQGSQSFVMYDTGRVQGFLELVTTYSGALGPDIEYVIAAGARFQQSQESPRPEPDWTIEGGLAYEKGGTKFEARYRALGPGALVKAWDHSLSASFTRRF